MEKGVMEGSDMGVCVKSGTDIGVKLGIEMLEKEIGVNEKLGIVMLGIEIGVWVKLGIVMSGMEIGV